MKSLSGIVLVVLIASATDAFILKLDQPAIVAQNWINAASNSKFEIAVTSVLSELLQGNVFTLHVLVAVTDCIKKVVWYPCALKSFKPTQQCVVKVTMDQNPHAKIIGCQDYP